jgi:hypothetical protein
MTAEQVVEAARGVCRVHYRTICRSKPEALQRRATPGAVLDAGSANAARSALLRFVVTDVAIPFLVLQPLGVRCVGRSSAAICLAA